MDEPLASVVDELFGSSLHSMVVFPGSVTVTTYVEVDNRDRPTCMHVCENGCTHCSKWATCFAEERKCALSRDQFSMAAWVPEM